MGSPVIYCSQHKAEVSIFQDFHDYAFIRFTFIPKCMLKKQRVHIDTVYTFTIQSDSKGCAEIERAVKGVELKKNFVLGTWSCK